MRLFILLYTYMFVHLPVTKNYIWFAVLIVLGVAAAVSLYLFKIHSVKKTKKIVNDLLKSKKLQIEPFINVNTAAWYIFQELPGFSRVSAKKVLWLKRHNGPYRSLDDFFAKNDITDAEIRKQLKKLIYVK